MQPRSLTPSPRNPQCLLDPARVLTSSKGPHKQPIMPTFQCTRTFWFSPIVSLRSIWSLLTKSLSLCNTRRIKIFQFHQKNISQNFGSRISDRRLNQHYEFLSEFQNTWQTGLNCTTPPPPSFPCYCTQYPRIYECYSESYLRKYLGCLRFFKMYLLFLHLQRQQEITKNNLL